MAGRFSPVVLGVLGMLTGVALTGVVMTTFTARANADTRAVPVHALGAAPAPAPLAAPATATASNAGPVGERLLDTTTATAPPRPLPTPNPFPKTNKGKRGASDEHLPSWVPLSGRLSVVQSHDLAENLGLVPAGTTKKAEGRIVVADMLAQNATASTSAANTTTTSPQNAPWLASNGRFRHSLQRGRGRGR